MSFGSGRGLVGAGGARVCALAGAALVTAVVIAGCGESSSTSTTTAADAARTIPSSPAVSTEASSSSPAVASVDGTPISKDAYEHWLTVERRLGGDSNAGHRALAFLITSQWVLEEAAARRVSVSEAEVRRRYEQVVRESFPKPGALRKYFARSGESEADLLARIKVELLTERIAAQVAAGKTGTARSALLSGFEQSFHDHWKALTSCQPGYVMEDCREYSGGPEDLTAARATRTSGSAGGGSSTGSASGASSGAGASAPGAFAVSSPAFAPGGQIPTKYTCAGAGVSPPLSWTNVPAGASELVLFVIDDSTQGTAGGVRWIVGGIDPRSSGVAEGKTPPGGIVGTNTAGRAAYSPICPAPGHSARIEIVMYALRHAIALSPGFQPAVAESEYGRSKDILGQAAVTYATASR